MANDVRERRSVPCGNKPGDMALPCGSTLYEYTWDFSVSPAKPVWQCTNCCKQTPRVQHHRRSNRSRAFAEWGNLNTAWKETDAALWALVEAKVVASGALLVHSSTWNYHMKQLVENNKPSNFDVKYHAAKAAEELEKAKQFVAEKNGTKVLLR